MDLEELRIVYTASGTEKAEADIKQMAAGIARATRDMTASLRAAGLAASSLTRRLSALGKVDARPRVHLDDLTGEISQVEELRLVLAELRGSYDADVNVTGALEGAGEVEALRGELESLRDTSVHVNAETSGGFTTGDRFTHMSRGVRGLLADLGVLSARLAASSLRATGLTAALLSGTAAAQAFGTVFTGVAGGATVGMLAAAAGEVVGLASAFAVAGAGVGAFAAIAAPTVMGVAKGFTEYTKAVEEARKAQELGDWKAYDKALVDQQLALAALTPAQREAVEGVQNLRDVWSATAREFEPTTLGLLNGGLSLLRDLLVQAAAVAGPVGDALRGVLDKARAGLQGDIFQQFITTTRANAGPLLAQFGEIGGNLITALLGGVTHSMPLVAVVMDGLVSASGRLSTALNGPGFDRFIGFAQDMLPLAGQVLGAWGKALGELAEGLAPLAGTALGVLTKIGEALTGAFSGPGMGRFVESVQDLLPIVGDALTQIGSGIGALLDLVRPLGPVVVQALGGVAQVLTEAFRSDAMKDFVATIAEAIPQLLPIVGSLVQLFTHVVSTVGKGLLPLIGPLGAAFEQIDTALAPVVDSLVAGLAPVIAQLIPPLTETARVLADGLVQILPPLAQWFSALVAAVAPLLPQLAQLVVDALVPLAEWMGKLMPVMAPVIEQLGGALIQALDQLVQALGPVIVQIAEALVPVVEALAAQLPSLIPMWEGIVDALLPVIPALAQVVIDLLPALLPLIEQWGDMVRVATPFIVDLAKAVAWVVETLAGLMSFTAQMISGDFTGAWQAARDAIGSVVTVLGDVASTVVGVFADAGQWLWDAGKSIIQGLVDGLRAGFDDVKDALGWLTGKLGDWKGPMAVDARLLVPNGAAIMGSLVDGFRLGAPSVRSYLEGLTAGISPTVGVDYQLAALGPAPATPSFTAGPVAASGAGRTIRVDVATTLNGFTASTAEPGSMEALMLDLLTQHDQAVAAELTRALSGAPSVGVF